MTTKDIDAAMEEWASKDPQAYRKFLEQERQAARSVSVSDKQLVDDTVLVDMDAAAQPLPPPTPTRPIPEKEFAITQDAKIWLLRSTMSYRQIARALNVTLGTVKADFSRAKKTVAKLQADPGWVGEATLMGYIRGYHNLETEDEEDYLYDDEKHLSYAELSAALDADAADDYEPEFFEDEPDLSD